MRDHIRVQTSAAGLILMGMFVLGFTACGVSQRPGPRADGEVKPGWPGEFPKANPVFRQASYPELRAAFPVIQDAELVNDDELCLTCHKAYTESLKDNIHRNLHEGHACESCHGPASLHMKTRGKEPGTILSFKKLAPASAAELCLKCHEENACAPGARWRTSVHAHNNLTCTSCHRAHYNVPPGTPATTEPDANARLGAKSMVKLASHRQEQPAAPPSLRGTSNNLDADVPGTCYKCHGDKADMQRIAGPHQIGGANGFNCNTCHDSHGKILEVSRKDLCLQCHKQNSPTMAWHSSTHDLMGVACTDCHNPHPRATVQQFVGISHTDVARAKRLSMSVDEPDACYKCHPKIFALNALPSHHPIKEGKMICSDCHDAHGQREGNLKGETLNLLCWKCHADKQGPFAYEHPPVTENCGYCHQPHGTVANNLLKQPTTFLCLRCHNGHRQSNHGRGASTINGVLTGARADIDRVPALRAALYTDCSTCHSQIHGSDMPTAHSAGVLSR